MIDVIKRGLKFLKKCVASCKTRLKTDLKAEIISIEDDECQIVNGWMWSYSWSLTDEEICDGFTHWQRENTTPPPSCREALQAKFTIKYIPTIGEPYARKLGAFWQTLPPQLGSSRPKK